jgi:hypothetical protein
VPRTRNQVRTRKAYKASSKTPYQRMRTDQKLSRCGAQRKGKAGLCQHEAGYGTDHVGFGRCKYHGGSTGSSKASAIKNEAVQFMGAPFDITPIDAIIWCVRITSGEIAFLSTELAKITEKDDWYEETVAGKQMHVLQRARADAQDRLVNYSKVAISLGLAERSIRLAEQFGATIARLLEGIKSELTLSPAQTNMWPTIVRRHLILLEGGTPPVKGGVIEGEAVRKELAS